MADINLLPQELRVSTEPKKPLPARKEQSLVAPAYSANSANTANKPPQIPSSPRPTVHVMSTPLRNTPPTTPSQPLPRIDGNQNFQKPPLASPSEITRITLIPETQEKASSHAGHISPWIIPTVVTLVALLINGVMGALLMTKKIVLTKQRTQEAMLESKVQEEEKTLQPHIVLLQQAEEAEKLLVQHYYMSHFFTLLEQATLPTTTYEHFTLHESQGKGKGRHGSLVLLTSSFADMAAQITLFLGAHHMMQNVTYASARKEKTELGEQVRTEVQFDIVSSTL